MIIQNVLTSLRTHMAENFEIFLLGLLKHQQTFKLTERNLPHHSLNFPLTREIHRYNCFEHHEKNSRIIK